MKTIEIPEDVMLGLYRIMCGVNYSMSGYDRYGEVSMASMRRAQKYILEYGEAHHFDDPGQMLLKNLTKNQ